MAKFVNGQSGSPAGKPKGARHKTTLLAEKPMQAGTDRTDAQLIANAIIAVAKNGGIAGTRLFPECYLPAPRDAKLARLAQRAEEAILKAVAANKLAVADAIYVLRLASEIRNNPLFRLADIQRRAVIVDIGMMRGDSIDDMLADLELNDESWGAANETVSRATWEQIDAYYGHPRPNTAAE